MPPIAVATPRLWRISRQNLYSRVLLVAVILSLRVGLDASYVYIVSPIFSHEGYVVQIDLYKLINSYFLTLFLALAVPSRVRMPSDILVMLLFLIPVLPTLSVYGLRDESSAYTYMVVVAFLTVLATRTRLRFRIPQLRQGPFVGVSLCVIGTLTVLIWLVTQGGLGSFNLDLTRVYEFRAVANEVLYRGLFGYLVTWGAKTFNIALIAWSLYKRKYFLFFIVLGIQVLLFGLTSHKSILLSPILIFILYFFAHRRHALHLLVLAILCMIVFASIVSFGLGDVFTSSLFIRRALYAPASLNYAYYKFFSEAGHVYMSDSVLSFMFEYPFSFSPVHLISNYLSGHTYTWANNGFLATSYMHFGFPGMIIFSVLVGLLLNVVDMLIVGKLPPWFGLSLVVVPFSNLFTSTDLGTALLTHGVAISLLVLWLFGRQKYSTRPKSWSIFEHEHSC